jgi:hypothetical protein
LRGHAGKFLIRRNGRTSPALDDDRFVPDDLKMAYKVLKMSGYLPPEIEERRK